MKPLAVGPVKYAVLEDNRATQTPTTKPNAHPQQLPHRVRRPATGNTGRAPG